MPVCSSATTVQSTNVARVELLHILPIFPLFFKSLFKHCTSTLGLRAPPPVSRHKRTLSSFWPILKNQSKDDIGDLTLCGTTNKHSDVPDCRGRETSQTHHDHVTPYGYDASRPHKIGYEALCLCLLKTRLHSCFRKSDCL